MLKAVDVNPLILRLTKSQGTRRIRGLTSPARLDSVGRRLNQHAVPLAQALFRGPFICFNSNAVVELPVRAWLGPADTQPRHDE